MSDSPFDQEVTLRLELSRSDSRMAVGLCVLSASTGALRHLRRQFLHPGELLLAAAMPVQKRADDFLRGRYACKRAIAALHPGIDPTGVHIGMGVFRQPVLQAPNTLGLQVSISHSGAIGAALAFAEGHPMAIDVEQYGAGRARVIESALTAHEVTLAAQMRLPRLQAYTQLWTMKEALSKVLKCGLTSPFHILEVAGVEHAGVGHAACFRHFTQYRAIACSLAESACAIVLPRESRGLAVETLLAAFAASTAKRQANAVLRVLPE